MSLDEKLREKLLDLTFGTYIDAPEGGIVPLRWEDSPVIDECVKEIKQVFQDEDKSKMVDYMAKGQLMTGQEWYDRFEKELQGETFFSEDNDIAAIGNTLLKVDLAARKASGLTYPSDSETI